MPNYEMTYSEMMGGAAGQAAYTSRIASERAAATTPTSVTPTASPPSGNAAAIASTQQQIADVQAKLANLQNISSVASQAGITTGNIPQELIDNPSGYLANWQASNIPITAPDMTTADASYASLDAMLQSQIKAAAGNQAKIDVALKTYEEQSKKLYQTSQIDIEGKRKELEEQYGSDASDYFAKRQSDLAAIGAMQKDYNAAVAARDLQLSGERERLAPMEFITTRMGRMERDANIRLNQMAADVNTRLGIMEMERGNFMDAQNLINQAVENYTAQAKWNYDVTKDYMDINKDIINNLSSTQKDILNNVQQLALLKLEETKSTATTNGNLILKYPTAGIKISDSYEEAIDKASRVAPIGEGLNAYQLQSALDRVSDDYRMDPMVKQFAQISSGYNFVQSIKTDTNNAADDIGMIYAFAKIMDPESVVREGEYATVQKYAQSWAQKFGFDIVRLYSNEKFLSPSAIANMKATAKVKYDASQQLYNQTNQVYQQRINDLQSGKIGTSLPDYTAGLPTGTEQESPLPTSGEKIIENIVQETQKDPLWKKIWNGITGLFK